MDQAGIMPEDGITELAEGQTPVSEEDLSAFRDFVEGLDLDDFGFE